MPYLKPASLASIATVAAASFFHVTAFADHDRALLLAQYEDLGACHAHARRRS